MRTGSYATKAHLIHKSSPKTDGDTLKVSLNFKEIPKNSRSFRLNFFEPDFWRHFVGPDAHGRFWPYRGSSTRQAADLQQGAAGCSRSAAADWRSSNLGRLRKL